MLECANASQSAADREHEALGEEHADGKGDVAELHETDPKDSGGKDAERSSYALRICSSVVMCCSSSLTFFLNHAIFALVTSLIFLHEKTARVVAAP